MKELIYKVSVHLVISFLLTILEGLLPLIGWQTINTDRFCAISDCIVEL